MVKTMAKSYNQYLKRMANRHPLLIAVGLPIIVRENGTHLQNIEADSIYDFRDQTIEGFIGGTPNSFKEGHAFNYNPSIKGLRIYIERISKIDVSKDSKKIEYRILTDRWD
jgi:hypothetical protein